MSDAKLRLEELRANKATRDAKASEEADARELAILELEEKYTSELGKRGRYFEIVETPEGPIVVKLGEGVLFKRLRDKKGEPTSDDIQQFVAPCVVHPDKTTFSKMVEGRFGILTRCSDALLCLYRGEDTHRSGEF
jgi:hypothetical protein